MNTSEIATRVKTQFGDTDGAQIVDADILRWINDAQREIVLEVELMQRKSIANIVTTSADYTLSAINASILRIIAVMYKNTSGNAIQLKGVNFREAITMFPETNNTTPSTGEPTHYTIWNGTLTLYPKASSAVTNGLIIYYVGQPTVLTAISATNVLGVDLPDLPVEYHNRIVEYAIAQAAELDDDSNLHVMKMNQFKDGVINQRDNSERQPQDYYPSITYTGDGYYG